MDIREQFGNRLTELRKERKMTQDKLAELSGLTRVYISGIEQGKRNVSLEVIAKLVEALEIKITQFFEE
jgi:transcriptional regulator with XRE-family HTH domain